MQCPECGSEVTENDAMCHACGAHLGGTQTASAASHGQNFIWRHLEVFLFIGCIVLVAGGVGIVLWGWPHSPERTVNTSLEHSNPLAALMLLALSATLVTTIATALMGRLPYIRRIPGLNAIDDAVGRATEMGRPMLFSTGLGGLSIVTLQALAVASHVGRKAVRYGARMIMPVCDSSIMPITEQMMREVHASEGRPEAYRQDDIRFLSDRQFAYAAGVTGILHRERVAASFLFGQFFAESLILAENGQAVGAIQVAGTPDLLQIPFFVVSCDYTIIGEEYYAASAYLSREPTQLGSLVGQDISKAFLFAIILVGMVLSIWMKTHPLTQWLGGG